MALAIVPPVKEVGEVGELETMAFEDPLTKEGLLLVTAGAVKAGGAIVRYTTEQPPNTEDPTHALIVKGYGGSEVAYAKFRTELATYGNAVTTYRPPRTLGDQNPERMQSKAAWAVAKELGKSNGTFETDLVTHSMGSWLGANIAEHKPHAIRNLIVMGGAGLTGHNIISLAPGALQLGMNVIRDVPRIRSLEYTRDDVIQAVRHVIINPLRSLGEMAAVSGCDIRETLPRLGALGVNVAVVQFEKDELFETNQVARYTEAAGLELVVIPDLGHAAPITHPQEVAKAVDDVLRA